MDDDARTALVDLLLGSLASAGDRFAGVCSILGPWGSGKTAILRAFVDRARASGARVVYVTCSPEHRDTDGAVLDLVRSALEFDDGGLRHPSTPVTLPEQGRPMDSPDQVLAALAPLLADGPIVLAVDDVEYADQHSLAAFRDRGPWLRRQGAMVVYTSGGPWNPAARSDSVLSDVTDYVYYVPPITSSGVRAALADAGVDDAPLTDAVIEGVNGNPALASALIADLATSDGSGPPLRAGRAYLRCVDSALRHLGPEAEQLCGLLAMVPVCSTASASALASMLGKSNAEARTLLDALGAVGLIDGSRFRIDGTAEHLRAAAARDADSPTVRFLADNRAPESAAVPVVLAALRRGDRDAATRAIAGLGSRPILPTPRVITQIHLAYAWYYGRWAGPERELVRDLTPALLDPWTSLIDAVTRPDDGDVDLQTAVDHLLADLLSGPAVPEAIAHVVEALVSRHPDADFSGWTARIEAVAEASTDPAESALLHTVRAATLVHTGDRPAARLLVDRAFRILPSGRWGAALGFPLATGLAAAEVHTAGTSGPSGPPDLMATTFHDLRVLLARARRLAENGAVLAAMGDLQAVDRLAVQCGLDGPVVERARAELVALRAGFPGSVLGDTVPWMLSGIPGPTGGRASRGSGPDDEGDDHRLSGAELRVAELAAEGLTNRAIGRRLHVTVSTVEQHLTKVYRKLGVSGRVDLSTGIARSRAEYAGPGHHLHPIVFRPRTDPYRLEAKEI
ncbi:helix-turn-helix transcriptional regulator [Dietzia psychralcaliphila]|uniref:helix-turn-helix transcriptional regulator n=1 Tax=Dietzia psychralcaliphila TaxID=139021 RepID=UPI0020A6831E|nr:AAA family ATPase [Dietzia psychralcaliphila]